MNRQISSCDKVLFLNKRIGVITLLGLLTHGLAVAQTKSNSSDSLNSSNNPQSSADDDKTGEQVSPNLSKKNQTKSQDRQEQISITSEAIGNGNKSLAKAYYKNYILPIKSKNNKFTNLIQKPTSAPREELNAAGNSTNYNLVINSDLPTSTTGINKKNNDCSTALRNGILQRASCTTTTTTKAITVRQAIPLRKNRQQFSKKDQMEKVPQVPSMVSKVAEIVAVNPKTPLNPISQPQTKRINRREISFTNSTAEVLAIAQPQPPQYNVAIRTLKNPEQTTEQTTEKSPEKTLENKRPNTSLLFPLSIPVPISSAFGWRIHPISGNRRMHTGTDLSAPIGTPVLAAYGGKVEIAGNMGGYGLMVSLRHENNTQESRYAHLSEIFVKPGEWVEKGTVIGLVGTTGNSTGPHLHFEWRHETKAGWVAVDAGIHIEYALQNLIQSIQLANNKQ